MTSGRFQVLLVLAVLVWSGIDPHERDIWFLEVSPVLLGGGALLWRWSRFPWTPLACWLVTAFCLVLCVGGHYTYALVPAGDWVAEQLGWQRNPFDRLGHLLQGVVPAVMARELLLRRTPLERGAALFWIVTAIALAISASYELLEWWTALIVDPEAGTAFLGSQGDPWDAQWDMALALGGALTVQRLAARLHDRQLAALADTTSG